MTATYWEIGRRIVESEMHGENRADYGEKLVEQLAIDLSRRFGRGFGKANLWQMRRFYRTWPEKGILQTSSGESGSSVIAPTVSELPLSRPASPYRDLPTFGSWRHIADGVCDLEEDSDFQAESEEFLECRNMASTSLAVDSILWPRSPTCIMRIKLPTTLHVWVQ